MSRRPRNTLLLVLGAGLLLALGACASPGLSDEEAEALRDELTTVRDRLDDMESEMQALEEDEEADAEAIAQAVREAIQEARETTDQVREELEPPEEPAPAGDPGGGGALDGGGVGQPAAP